MIHVVIRTCNRTSLQSDRIVNKSECILRCLNSIINNLKDIPEKTLHIVDDNSSIDFQDILKELIHPHEFVTIDFLPAISQEGLTPKKKSRYSVKVAYNYIYNLPDDDLVYIVEDDYLHFPGAIGEMIDSWTYLSNITGLEIGIFPQDFNQLYYHPSNPHNETYFRHCLVVPTLTKYYRTTWFTQESFMVQSKIFKKYKEHFDSLLIIGDEEHNWEGNTISNIWTKPEFKMFMPMGSLVVHMSNKMDIPHFISKEDVINLWKQNETYWSLERDSQVLL
jgi:glycosyltransferase involved in cell wall biosynthesis